MHNKYQLVFIYLRIIYLFSTQVPGKQLILQSNLWLSGHRSGSEVYYNDAKFVYSFKKNINLRLVPLRLPLVCVRIFKRMLNYFN